MSEPWHPRRQAIGALLSRAIPVPRTDAEEQAERKLLRRADIRKALK